MFSTMIVDDYAVFRKELHDMPVWGEDSGFVITEEAANGRDALQKLLKNPVDLLLTDIRMPTMDGLELIKKATEQSLACCIIIMSQFSDFEYARTGLSSGALDYLLKPVDQTALAKVLQRASAHISEKRLSSSRMSYLENILSNAAEEFFPAPELDRLVTLLGEGSRDALAAAEYLTDATLTEVGFDGVKAARILSRVLKRLAESLPGDYKWLDKFMNLQELRLGDIDEASAAGLKETFTGKIGALLSVIRKYELDIDSDGIVRTACRTILENVDTDMTVSELAGNLFITRTYLSQIFKEKTGTTLVKYMTDVKIERAKMLISSGSKNYEIAEKLGYKDDEYFKKLFKKATGMTINEYKSAAG